MYGHAPASHTTPRRGQDARPTEMRENCVHPRPTDKSTATPSRRATATIPPLHSTIPRDMYGHAPANHTTPRRGQDPALRNAGKLRSPPPDKSTATPSRRATATTRQVFAGCMSFAVLFFIKEIPERIPNKNPRCGDFHSGDFVENSFGTFLIRKVQRTSCAQDYLYRSTRRDRCS